MQPRIDLVKIRDNRAKIGKMLSDLVLQPRLKTIEWARVTKQTANLKVGYPGQHLASLITGMQGEHTGARGNDLVDGSEVKACSRIDQLDKCNTCKLPVPRIDAKCAACGSNDIKRMDDSKWLFTIRSEQDLALLVKKVPRVLLILGDYPRFGEKNFQELRFQAFEIWPQSKRQSRFAELMTNYYENIYRVHKDRDPDKTPAPKNFWPFSYQFFMCNPILVFSCTVKKADTSPELLITHYIEPEADRSQLPSLSMPRHLVTEDEIALLAREARSDELLSSFDKLTEDMVRASAADLAAKLPYLNETLRAYLPLRDDRTAQATRKHKRRSY